MTENSTIDTQIEAVLGSVTSQRLTTLPAPASAVHRRILWTFADTGTAPTRAQLGDLGDSTADHLVTLATGDIIGLDAHGEITYAYPFSTTPTPHRLHLPSGAQPYAMCAIDALGIPTMLDTDAVITSRDPHTGDPITVTVTDRGATARWDPADAVVFAGSRTDCCATTSAESCCGYLNFFTSYATADAWATAHPEIRGLVLDQDRALALGVRCFGDLLREQTTT